MQLVDEDYKVSHTGTQLSALMLRMWAERVVLPYDINELASWIHAQLQEFDKTHEAVLRRNRLRLG